MAAFEEIPTAVVSTPVVAEVIGFQPPTIPAMPAIPAEQIELLKGMGLTQGLAESLICTAENTVRRYWIVDNSGSMSTQDGNHIVISPEGEQVVSCSRWDELCDSLKWHARVSEILGAHTEFRMLNNPKGEASQTVSVDDSSFGPIQSIDEVTRSSPLKQTPLCAALKRLVADIQALAPELEDAGKSVSVIIASDGEATDGDMNDVKAALAPLIDLPCDVVVRLCTDESNVVDYWNAIDGDLELELDVLDDTAGEGKEVRGFNPWIGYGEALQRVREFGNAPKVFDLLDENALSLHEGVEVVKLIFGEEATARFPNAQLCPADYREQLKSLIDAKILLVFDASQNKRVSWIDFRLFSTNVLMNTTPAAAAVNT